MNRGLPSHDEALRIVDEFIYNPDRLDDPTKFADFVASCMRTYPAINALIQRSRTHDPGTSGDEYGEIMRFLEDEGVVSEADFRDRDKEMRDIFRDDIERIGG